MARLAKELDTEILRRGPETVINPTPDICMYRYVCIYIYIYIYTYIYIYIYFVVRLAKELETEIMRRGPETVINPRVHPIYVCIDMCVNTYIYIYIRIHIHIHISMLRGAIGEGIGDGNNSPWPRDGD